MNRAERRALGQRGPNHPTVQMMYLHPGEVSAAFMASVLRCRDYEVVRTGQLFGTSERRARSGGIARARNEMTEAFCDGQADWLWFVDADMGFPKDALHKMLAAADPADRPVVGGLCFAQASNAYEEETNAEYFALIPTLSVWEKDDGGQILGFRTVTDYPRDAMCKVNATGAALLLIHRSVVCDMRDVYGPNWWSELPRQNGATFSEDTSFCIRLDQMGVPLFVHTGVRTSHDKGGVFLTERLWDEQQARA